MVGVNLGGYTLKQKEQDLNSDFNAPIKPLPKTPTTLLQPNDWEKKIKKQKDNQTKKHWTTVEKFNLVENIQHFEKVHANIIKPSVTPLKDSMRGVLTKIPDSGGGFTNFWFIEPVNTIVRDETAEFKDTRHSQEKVRNQQKTTQKDIAVQNFLLEKDVLDSAKKLFPAKEDKKNTSIT